MYEGLRPPSRLSPLTVSRGSVFPHMLVNPRQVLPQPGLKQTVRLHNR